MPDNINVNLPSSGSTVGGEELDLKGDLELLDKEDAPSEEEAESESERSEDEEPKEAASTEDEESKGESEEDEESEDEEDKTKKPKSEVAEEEELVRYSYGDIKSKYPNFFKDFPGLKTAFFKEQEFSKIFPSLDEAREALEVKERFENVRDTVYSGDAETLLKQIPEGPRTKFAENFLPDLFTVDKDAYYSVTTPVIQNVIGNVFKAAAQKRDNNLGNAAILAYQEIFGGELEDIQSTLARGVEFKTTRATEVSPERQEIYREREQLNLEKRIGLQTIAWSEVSKELTRDIEKGLDPNNAIRPGLRKIIVDKIFNEVVSEVAADAAHVKRMDDLWERERRAGYRGAFKDSLKNTYLSRAKALIPKHRQRIRAEIAGNQKVNDKALAAKVKDRESRKDVQAGKPAGSKRITSAKDPEFRKMSDFEFLSK